MRYSVVTSLIDTNLSHSHCTHYTFEAKSDEDALNILKEEHSKARRYPKYSRLVSGGVYWKHAKLFNNGRAVNE